jgi:hypothetical protein
VQVDVVEQVPQFEGQELHTPDWSTYPDEHLEQNTLDPTLMQATQFPMEHAKHWELLRKYPVKQDEHTVLEVEQDPQFKGQLRQYKEFDDFTYPLLQDIIAVWLEQEELPWGQLLHVNVVLSRYAPV